METCKAAGLYFLRSAPATASDAVPGKSDRLTPLPSENSVGVRLARPLLGKLVRDARAFQKHLERGVLDYFGLAGSFDEPDHQSCLSALNSSIYAPLFELLWPIYRTVNRDLDRKYIKRVRILQSMNDEQLFEALEMDMRFRLLPHLHSHISSSPKDTHAEPIETASRRESFERALSPPPIEIPPSIAFEPDRPLSPAPMLLSQSRSSSVDSGRGSLLSPAPLRAMQTRDGIDDAESGRSNGNVMTLDTELMRRLEQERIEGVASPFSSSTVEMSPYQQAVESLKRISEVKSPDQKLLVLRQSFILMNQAITRFWTDRPGAKSIDKYRIASVDELLPVFMFVVIRAEVPLLQSECNYVCDFLDDHLSIGEAGMMTQTLAASLHHIVTFDWFQFFNVQYHVKPTLSHPKNKARHK